MVKPLEFRADALGKSQYHELVNAAWQYRFEFEVIAELFDMLD